MMQSTENSANSNNRIDWIDSAKGIGIILVVLGHTFDIPHWLYCLIYGFHMPLFFILSGLTYRCDNGEDAGRHIRKLAKRYLLPYLGLAGINLVLHCTWLLYLGELNLQVFLKYICGILYCYANMDWMPNCSPIWFLPGIFFAKLFVFAAYRLFRGDKWKITAAIALMGTAAFSADHLGVPRLPWNVLPAMMGSVFLWAGYCLRQDSQFMQRGLNRISTAALTAALLMTPWIGSNVPGMNQNFYDNVVLFLVSGFGYSFGIILLVVAFPKIHSFFAYFGAGSMVFMGFNYFARTASTEMYYLIPYIRDNTIHPAISFLATMGILIAILEIFKRTKDKYRRTCHAV